MAIIMVSREDSKYSVVLVISGPGWGVGTHPALSKTHTWSMEQTSNSGAYTGHTRGALGYFLWTL